MAWFERIKAPFSDSEADARGLHRSDAERVGSELRARRTALGIELTDAATALRIKTAYLAAIEEERFDQLPAAVYALGFVRSYAAYLGLDSGNLARRFKLEEAGLNSKPDLSFPMPLADRSLPGGSVLLAAVVLAACGYGLWYHLASTQVARPERVAEVPAQLRLSTAGGTSHLNGRESPTHTGSAMEEPGPRNAEDKMPAAEPGPAPAGEGLAIAPAQPTASKSDGSQDSTDSPPAASPSERAASSIAAAESAAVPETTAASERTAAAAAAGQNPVMPPAAAVASIAPPAPPGEVPAPPASAHAPTDGPAAGAARQSQSADPHVSEISGAASRVILRANSPSWVQIRAADHAILYTGLLKTGDTYRVPPQSGLTMRVGNAGGLDITVDGKTAPAVGPIGAVRNVSLDPAILLAGSGPQDRPAQ
jgi:cytoskeleton protein RodZ